MNLAVATQFMTGLGEKATAQTSDFESILGLYRSKVFRFILASTRDKDTAETLTQDCFFSAYRAWNRFRGDSSVETWLMKIAVNLIRDRARNRRLQFWRQTQLTGKPVEALGDRLADHQRSPEQHALLKEKVMAVWEAAATLPERQRTVFLLRFVEDMDLAEIAAVTGAKEGTVKTHLFRALQAVRERMGDRK
jgi:RNA polymerase sigma-70 factor, ECF subfamily